MTTVTADHRPGKPFWEGMSNPANVLPPDFDDMQPSDYDPQFTADINTKMRVPERIGLVDDSGMSTFNDYTPQDNNEQNMRRSMNVPERILLAGNNEETVGARHDPRFDLRDPTMIGEPYQPVSLSTPPRNLKLDEDIYSKMDDLELEEKLAAAAQQNGYLDYTSHHVTEDGDQETSRSLVPQNKRMENSLLASPSGDLMIQDVDDTQALRMKLDRVSRHVIRLEQDNEKRNQREMILYPAMIAFALFKIAQWLLKN